MSAGYEASKFQKLEGGLLEGWFASAVRALLDKIGSIKMSDWRKFEKVIRGGAEQGR